MGAAVAQVLVAGVYTRCVRKKVNYVLDVSKLLYSKTGIDITVEVKAELARLDAEATKK
jgi:Skp family chaperone for outer membrane proteins